jgi:hypothetical protein
MQLCELNPIIGRLWAGHKILNFVTNKKNTFLLLCLASNLGQLVCNYLQNHFSYTYVQKGCHNFSKYFALKDCLWLN